MPCFLHVRLRPASTALLLGVLAATAFPQSLPIKAGPAELIESGSPSFIVLGPEALGFATAPVDLKLMPDGRLLAVGQHELALGDGIRWEVFRQAEGDEPVDTLNVNVSPTGQIFAGISGGFARIDFGQNTRWHFVPVAKLPPEISERTPPLVRSAIAGDTWLWWWGSGPVVAWKPGTEAKLVGRANAPESAFILDGKLHLSDGSTGALYRMENDFLQLITAPYSLRVDQAITSLVPLDHGRALVGTISNGIQLSEDNKLSPLVNSDLLAGEHRINDLCATEGGFFAAAVDNIGIVFFNQAGRIVQVLDRSNDHRLARVKRLLPSANGIIWALLNEGIARVAFPDRVSHLEPLVSTGLAFAVPYRLNGLLWLVSDGRAQRGIYDANHRLVRFELDTPPGLLSSMIELDGHVIACSTDGIFLRTADGKWSVINRDIPSANISLEPVSPGRWLYAAQEEVGWVKLENDRLVFERFPVPGLGHVFGGMTDQHGVYWAELGTARVARISPSLPQPTVELFGINEGVPDGWVQVFKIDGEARINVPDQIKKLDGASRRFVPDTALLRELPQLAGAIGRPTRDAFGKLWVTNRGQVQIYPPASLPSDPPEEILPNGLAPTHFSTQSDGVVWLHQRMHLARYDPTIPVARPAPLQVLITRVQLLNSNRDIYTVGDRLPPLAATDNALTVHFLAPNSSITQPVTFEVKLEGATGGWASTGVAGSVAFNHLGQGNYELRVRPRSGGTLGEEARLSFAILAPWYRTQYAYLGYAVALFGAIVGAARLASLLSRRENARLEKLVAQRTQELNQSNTRLASQVEQIQMLLQAIQQSPVGVLITEPDGSVVFTNPRVCDLTRYQADEIIGKNAAILEPTGIEPKLGREISAKIAQGESWHGQLTKRRKDGTTFEVRTSIAPIRSPNNQIRLHLILIEDITGLLADQERRHRLENQLIQSQKLESLGTLAGGIAHDFNNILTGILGCNELAQMIAPADPELQEQLTQVRKAGLRAKDLVMQILTFSRRNITRLVPLDLADSVTETLKLIRATTPATIEIISRLESGTVLADATQIQQVVLNLCTNAIHAMHRGPGRLEVTLQHVMVDEALAVELNAFPSGPALRLSIADNGHGMNEETIRRIFDPFFTTKAPGKGTGLGLSIVQGVMVSHRGALRVRSTPEIGTTFELYFPASAEIIPPAAPLDTVPRGAGQEIILVDDEPAVAKFAATRLQQLGYRVTLFHDPREALAALHATPARFQAIITDLTMPYLTGIQLIQQARASHPAIPAIIITGYGMADESNKLETLTRCRLLPKPFSGEDLARILHEELLKNTAAPT